MLESQQTLQATGFGKTQGGGNIMLARLSNCNHNPKRQTTGFGVNLSFLSYKSIPNPQQRASSTELALIFFVNQTNFAVQILFNL